MNMQTSNPSGRDGGRESLRAVKRVAENIREPSVVSQVDERLVQGDSSAIGLLEPVAQHVPPAQAVELLEAAAAFCQAEALERLFSIFGEFEFTCNALVLALLAGRPKNAQVLLAHGADFDFEFDPAVVNERIENDTPKQRNWRFVTYMNRALSGTFYQWYFPAEKMLTKHKHELDGTYFIDAFSPVLKYTLPCTGQRALVGIAYAPKVTALAIEELAHQGLLSPVQLASLAMSAAYHGCTQEAMRIAHCITGAFPCVSLVVWEGDPRFLRQQRKMYQPVDLLTPACSAGLAHFVAQVAPPGQVEAWSCEQFVAKEYIAGDHDALAALMPRLHSSVKSNAELTLIAASHGLLAELERAFETAASADIALMRKCLDAAQSTGHVEAAAWLLKRISLSEASQEGLWL